MSRSSAMKALVFWSREAKTGIEPVGNVPEQSRFAGAITSVRFSGDKKWYPAKVLLLSSSQAELESAARDVERKIEEEKTNSSLPPKRSRKQKTTVPLPSVASERNIAQALGSRPPVPKNLQESQKSLQKTKKMDKESAAKAQKALESTVASSIRKNLFSSTTQSNALVNAPTPPDQSAGDRDEGGDSSDEEMADNLDDDDDNMNDDEDSEDKDEGDKVEQGDAQMSDLTIDDAEEVSVWCNSCSVCSTLKKYDDVAYYSFLKDLVTLYERKSQQGNKMYLKLKEIPKSVMTVELKKGSGVMISSDTKMQLKVDYKNKPSSLVRETLYALYGEEAFRTCKVTGRGNAEGAFTIQPHVLTALRSFVNNNVAKNKQIKTKQLVAVINKRAPEWLRSPKLKEKSVGNKSKKRVSASSGVISTSPFKAAPLVPTEALVADNSNTSDEANVLVESSPCKAAQKLNSFANPAKDAPQLNSIPFSASRPSAPPHGLSPGKQFGSNVLTPIYYGPSKDAPQLNSIPFPAPRPPAPPHGLSPGKHFGSNVLTPINYGPSNAYSYYPNYYNGQDHSYNSNQDQFGHYGQHGQHSNYHQQDSNFGHGYGNNTSEIGN